MAVVLCVSIKIPVFFEIPLVTVLLNVDFRPFVDFSTVVLVWGDCLRHSHFGKLFLFNVLLGTCSD